MRYGTLYALICHDIIELQAETYSLYVRSPMDYLTTSEAIELLGVTRLTLYRWVYSGTMPAYRKNGQYRFKRSDVEKRVQERAAIIPATSPGP